MAFDLVFVFHTCIDVHVNLKKWTNTSSRKWMYSNLYFLNAIFTIFISLLVQSLQMNLMCTLWLKKCIQILIGKPEGKRVLVELWHGMLKCIFENYCVIVWTGFILLRVHCIYGFVCLSLQVSSKTKKMSCNVWVTVSFSKKKVSDVWS